MANRMNIAIVECRHCGAAYWVEAWIGADAIDGGPCCFGHEVLDIERFPTERAAQKEWPAWFARRLDTQRAVWRKYHGEGAAA